MFCGEKTAIQALDRSIPFCRCRPTAPSVRARHALSLRAALDVRTGKVEGKTAPRHTSNDFSRFRDWTRCKNELDEKCTSSSIIMSIHKTKQFSSSCWQPEGTLPLHSNLLFVVEPSWDLTLNTQRHVIDCGVFTSIPDLGRKIRKYIKADAK